MTYKKVAGEDAIGLHVSKVATDSGHEFELHLTLQQNRGGKVIAKKTLTDILYKMIDVD